MANIIPDDMNVPISRKDTRKPENVRWLIHNLKIKNSGHPQFKSVMRKLVNINLLNR